MFRNKQLFLCVPKVPPRSHVAGLLQHFNGTALKVRRVVDASHAQKVLSWTSSYGKSTWSTVEPHLKSVGDWTSSSVRNVKAQLPSPKAPLERTQGMVEPHLESAQTWTKVWIEKGRHTVKSIASSPAAKMTREWVSETAQKSVPSAHRMPFYRTFYILRGTYRNWVLIQRLAYLFLMFVLTAVVARYIESLTSALIAIKNTFFVVEERLIGNGNK